MTHNKLYVQFGAGTEAIDGWVNFDSSPTLLIQKMPIIGLLLRKRLNCAFDKEIKYGDIVRGLPLRNESVDGMFCSHVLEHLTYCDFYKAISNSFIYLKSGAIFRLIVPDLEYYINTYIEARESTDESKIQAASYDFNKNSVLGREFSREKVKDRLVDAFRGSGHRWMWDYNGLRKALIDTGFKSVAKFRQGESDDEMFLKCEKDHMFGDKNGEFGLSIQCVKP